MVLLFPQTTQYLECLVGLVIPQVVTAVWSLMIINKQRTGRLSPNTGHQIFIDNGISRRKAVTGGEMSVSSEGYYSVGQERTTAKMRASLESYYIPFQDRPPAPVVTRPLSPKPPIPLPSFSSNLTLTKLPGCSRIQKLVLLGASVSGEIERKPCREEGATRWKGQRPE